MALFAQYAMACAEEALNDAGWEPKSEDDLEATVCCRWWWWPGNHPLMKLTCYRVFISGLGLAVWTMFTTRPLATRLEYESSLPTHWEEIRADRLQGIQKGLAPFRSQAAH